MRRTPHPTPSAAGALLLTALLTSLLTACGTESTGTSTANTPLASGCGEPITASPTTMSSDPQALEKDGVKILGFVVGRNCVEYEVTNSGTEPMTYTIGFTFAGGTPASTQHEEETIDSVEPGRTIRRTLTATGAPGLTEATIGTVRSVPTAEAPAPAATCPPSGVRVYANQGDAAMGLRALGLFVENCGTGAYQLNGYPTLELLDADHEPVDGVDILDGAGDIATSTGADTLPSPITLNTGERARATLVWRNTTGMGEVVNAPYTRVWAKPGADPVTVTPELDLGTTGQLGVGAWAKDTEYQAPTPGALP
ncbi:DUF4232 domain-containing protein [Streptomyces sp. NPDC056716]|uniref:DUF4232 domain-containing protein n=1 Tax=unclassified Streptomyces TaxID=2593676 RepID=UPI0036BB1983